MAGSGHNKLDLLSGSIAKPVIAPGYWQQRSSSGPILYVAVAPPIV